MKKKWLIATILSSSLLLPVHQAEANEHQDIRFRVLAHSDEEKDQAIKQTIYTLVQEQILQTFAGDKQWDREDLIQQMEKHVEDWEQLVQQKLADEGFTYSATVRFEKHLFPEKQTEDRVYEEGLFDTILVTLGEGEGKNWWCSIFPDLCGQVLIKKAKAADKKDESECETDLSPEKDLSNENVEVESYIVNLFHKGWNWITN